MNGFLERLFSRRRRPFRTVPRNDLEFFLQSSRPIKPEYAKPTVVYHLDNDAAWRDTVAKAVQRSTSFSMGDLASANIVVLELWYNDECGFEIAARLKKRFDRLRILGLTTRADEVAMHRSQLGPLDGFVWKIPAATWQIEKALVELDHGRTYFPAEVIEERRRLEALPDAYFKVVTQNDIELLPFFARFMSDGEVAVEVGVMERTVRWHREKIQRAIGATSRTELVHWALGAGFAPLFLAAPPCLAGYEPVQQ